MQRVLNHVKYLPDFGWDPVVLTVQNGDFPARDESLMAKIPPSVPVYRTHIYEPYDLYRALTGKAKGSAVDVNVIKKEGQKSSFTESVAELIRATFFIPDARIGWLLTAPKEARSIIARHGVDAVYSSSPPYTCSLIARGIKRATGLPWVAGFRDPWTGFISTPKRWAVPKAIDIAMERSVFTEADAVECAWQGIIDDARSKYPLLPADKFAHVPNGFDPDDFPAVEYTPTEKFRIVYTGSMYGRRNPESFLKALDILHRRNTLSPSMLDIRLVGRFGNEILEMVNKSHFKQSVTIIPYLPHSESIAELLRADALLLVVDESKESEAIVPGKVFEYIGTGVPIITIAPTGGAIAEIVRQSGAGEVSHQSRPEETAAYIEKLFLEWQQTGNTARNSTANTGRYERRESTKMLAALLNREVDKKRGRP